MNWVLISVRRPVRQALVFNSLDGKGCPFPIGNTEAGPIMMAKSKFVQTELQALLTAKAIGNPGGDSSARCVLPGEARPAIWRRFVFNA